MLANQIINGLNAFLKNYLNLQYEPLYAKTANIYILQGNSNAINFRGNNLEEVKVIHWFDEFYLYIEIRFLEFYTHKLISVSLFHGNIDDTKKHQLFRAEWDDYNIDNENRPQPHWHITRDNAVYDKFSDFTNHDDEREKIGFEFFEKFKLMFLTQKKFILLCLVIGKTKFHQSIK